MIAAGWRAVLHAPAPQRALFFGLLLLLVLMLPFGRSGPNDGGGLLAPLCADSGSRSLFRLRPAADFFSVYDAGTRVLRGMDPYGVNLVAPGGAGLRAPYVATFRYPPLTALWLAAPLNLLPPWPAWVVWCVFCAALQVLNCLWCTARRPELLWLWSLLWFAWFPTIAELHMGQFTLLMATLLLWGADGLLAGRRWAGALWTLAVLIKVYPIAMAPSLWRWGRRGAVMAAVVALVGVSALWRALLPGAMDEGLVRRGVAGRVVGGERQPYAGAQGPQELMNTVVWKLRGRSLGEAAPPERSRPDVVFWLNAAQLATFGLLCAWALLRCRTPSAAALWLFWLAWFFAYHDCWEHHYLLLQALLAFLVLHGVVGPRVVLLCWLFAGAPSLWWLWQKAGYAGNPVAEALGTLYFVQRPVAVYLLAGLLAFRIGALSTGSSNSCESSA